MLDVAWLKREYPFHQTTRLGRLVMKDAEISVDYLLSILNRLGQSVEVRISAKEYDPDKAQTLVTVS